MIFDFHRHLTNSLPLNNALYCTSNINDWNKKCRYFSLGLLQDSFVPKVTLTKILEELEGKLIKNRELQIGEIGLDKRWGNLENQIYFLNNALDLAANYSRAITIHCVKEYPLLLNIISKRNTKAPLTIIHGFTGSYEVAKEFHKKDIKISLNPLFLKTRAFKDILKFDNLGFLVESDWDKTTDEGYVEYFSNFLMALDTFDAKKYKDYNNEIRTILQNITSDRK